jgi:hypothetical protein
MPLTSGDLHEDGESSLPWFFPFFILGLWFFAYYYGITLEHGTLVDPDGYMRLNRVLDLYNSGNWYNAVISRSNAPYGETSHWTRPLDVLLLAGARLFTPLADFKTALFWWGAMISPVMYVLSLIALVWAVKPLVSQPGRGYLGILFLAQPMILTYCWVGRPDHHSLLIFCLCLSLGLGLRLLQPGSSLRVCYAAGAMNAFSMWISVESLTVVLVYGLVLSLVWLWKDGDFSLTNLHFWMGLTAGTGLALIIEHPYYEWASTVYDSLSIMHVAIWGIITAFWLLYAVLRYYFPEIRKPSSRIATALGGLIIISGSICILFPKFFQGPCVDVDPKIALIWLSEVLEVQPLLPPQKDWLFNLTWYLGGALLALPAACYFFWQERRKEFQRWMLVLLGLLVFLPLALYQNRWATYAEVFILVALSELVSRILKRQASLIAEPWRRTVRFLTVLAVITIFSLAPLILDSVSKVDNSNAAKRKISLGPICQYLQERGGWYQQPKRILTHIDFGPEILYRTRYEVIATPYIRNTSGIWDSYRIMTVVDDLEAHRLIQKRGINLILLCPESRDSYIYANSTPGTTFHQRLTQGKLPGWLRPVSLPPNLSLSFQLFEVVG